jgi:hypothetical protein
VCQVLRNQVDLARPLHLQQLCLAHEVIKSERPMLSAHERNCTEGAAVVAPLAHLEVAHVRRLAGEYAHARVLEQRSSNQAALDHLRQQAVRLRRAEEHIDLGKRVDQLVLVPFDHAADREHCATRAIVLEPSGLEDRVD